MEFLSHFTHALGHSGWLTFGFAASAILSIFLIIDVIQSGGGLKKVSLLGISIIVVVAFLLYLCSTPEFSASL